MAHLEPPGANGLSVQCPVGLETGEAFRYLVHDPQLAVVVGSLPRAFSVLAFDEKPYAVKLGLADTDAVTRGNSETIAVRLWLAVGFRAFGQLTARYQTRAVGLGDVIMGLGMQGEIGGQFALEGDTLGEEGAQGSATA